jgi:hypothetical protein
MRRNVAIVVGLLALVGACNNGDGDERSESSPVVGDHWHAQLTVVDCGELQPVAPEFDIAVDGMRAGIHTHGDGFIHFHPFTRAELADATVGRFLAYQGHDIDEESFDLWDPIGARRTGDACPDGARGSVRWAVNGEERNGSLAEYRPKDGDSIVVGFLPDDQEIPPAPSATRAND